MKSWEELKQIPFENDHNLPQKVGDLSTMSLDNICTWEQLNAKNPLESLKQIKTEEYYITVNTQPMEGSSQIITVNTQPMEGSSQNITVNIQPMEVSSQIISKYDVLQDDVTSNINVNGETMQDIENTTFDTLQKQELLEGAAPLLTKLPDEKTQLSLDKNINFDFNNNNAKEFVTNDSSTENFVIYDTSPNEINILQQTQEQIPHLMAQQAQEQIPHAIEQQIPLDDHGLNIKLVKFVQTKKINYFDIINSAVNKALETARQNTSPEEHLSLPQIPPELENNTRIMENFKTSVFQTQEHYPSSLEDTLNTTTETLSNKLSEKAKATLERFDLLLEQTEKNDIELSRIADAGVEISQNARNIVNNLSTIEWWHNTGYWFSLLAVTATALTYMAYVYKFPILRTFIDKLLSLRPNMPLKDLTPSNVFNSSNPITINNAGANDTLLSSIINALATAAIGVSAFLTRNGMRITQTIIRKGK